MRIAPPQLELAQGSSLNLRHQHLAVEAGLLRIQIRDLRLDNQLLPDVRCLFAIYIGLCSLFPGASVNGAWLHAFDSINPGTAHKVSTEMSTEMSICSGGNVAKDDLTISRLARKL